MRRGLCTVRLRPYLRAFPPGDRVFCCRASDQFAFLVDKQKDANTPDGAQERVTFKNEIKAPRRVAHRRAHPTVLSERRPCTMVRHMQGRAAHTDVRTPKPTLPQPALVVQAPVVPQQAVVMAADGAAGSCFADRLHKAKDLLDQGLINQAEYDAKKAEILSRV